MKPEIKPFQSVQECPKCRALASEASYKYIDDEVWHDVLLRTCGRCGFTWPEHPAHHGQPVEIEG